VRKGIPSSGVSAFLMLVGFMLGRKFIDAGDPSTLTATNPLVNAVGKSVATP
jgi:hypothetical protein